MTATVYGLDNKVSKTGDTMSGNLNVPSLNVSGALNANPTFQGGLTPWALAVGASFTQSSSFAYPGQTYSARLVPDGVSPVIYAQSEQIACSASTAYTAQSWVYCPTGYSPGGGSGFTVGVNWYDASNSYISSSTSYVSVGAAAWTPFVATYTSPANAASFIIVPALNGTPAGTVIAYLYNTCVAAASMQDLASVVVQALQMPATGKSGYVLTADAYGNLTLQAATGGPTLPLSIANGGSGQTTQQAAIDALAGAVTTGDFLRGNGTHVVMAPLSSGDIPNNAANTSGTAGSFTGALAGDVTGTQSAAVVGKIQGVPITSTEATLVSDLNNAATHSSSATLLPGEESIFTGSTPSQTLTLPASPPTSSINTVTNTATVSVTIAPGAGAVISNFGTGGNITVPSGYVFGLVYIGTTWYVQSAGPNDFAKNSLLALGNGGTGQSTAAAAYNALSPMTTIGDLEYESGTNTAARLAGNSTATKKFLTETGTGTTPTAPTWGTLAAGDLPAATTSAQGAVVLDGTAGDIAPIGTQAAGATGKAADAGHVHASTSVVATSSVTVTGTTALTKLCDGITIPSGGLAAGQMYRFTAFGAISTTVDTQTVNIGLYLGGIGGTNILNWGAQAPNASATVTNAVWSLDIFLQLQSGTAAVAWGWDALNFFMSAITQSSVTVTNASSQELVIGVTPSASAVSIKAVGAGCWRVA